MYVLSSSCSCTAQGHEIAAWDGKGYGWEDGIVLLTLVRNNPVASLIYQPQLMGTEGEGWEAGKGRNTINMAENIIFTSFF
jgi:hypothetical protein